MARRGPLGRDRTARCRLTVAAGHSRLTSEKTQPHSSNSAVGQFKGFNKMVDIIPRDAPQLCPCGRTPLQCAVATLGAVHDELMTDPRGLPACCLGIARRATAELAKARVVAVANFSALREILLALRDDEIGQRTAAHCIENAAVTLEHFINAAERRTRRAIVLLRKRFGKDACPACRDESSLRRAAKQLRWCESMLNG
jgi:hypothetical protein